MVGADGWVGSKIHGRCLEHHLQSSLVPGNPHSPGAPLVCPGGSSWEREEEAKGLVTDYRTLLAPCRARDELHLGLSHLGLFTVIFFSFFGWG